MNSPARDGHSGESVDQGKTMSKTITILAALTLALPSVAEARAHGANGWATRMNREREAKQRIANDRILSAMARQQAVGSAPPRRPVRTKR